jgi:thymidylate kinase
MNSAIEVLQERIRALESNISYLSREIKDYNESVDNAYLKIDKYNQNKLELIEAIELLKEINNESGQ